MLQLIADPEFNDPSKWIVGSPHPALPAAAVVGGQLVYNESFGNTIASNSVGIKAVVGRRYEYELDVASYEHGVAYARYGGQQFWSSDMGAGVFRGPLTADIASWLVISGGEDFVLGAKFKLNSVRITDLGTLHETKGAESDVEVRGSKSEPQSVKSGRGQTSEGRADE